MFTVLQKDDLQQTDMIVDNQIAELLSSQRL